MKYCILATLKNKNQLYLKDRVGTLGLESVFDHGKPCGVAELDYDEAQTLAHQLRANSEYTSVDILELKYKEWSELYANLL